MRGKFRFCPACGEIPAGQAREFNKLASLSAEGRSSATTLLVSSVLRWMNKSGTDVDALKRKLLSFTDNRQDAALQAGHFNDFIFVSLLRAATLAALRRAGEEGLGDDDIGARNPRGPRLQTQLGIAAYRVDARPGHNWRRTDHRGQSDRAGAPLSRVGRPAAWLAIHKSKSRRIGASALRLPLP